MSNRQTFEIGNHNMSGGNTTMYRLSRDRDEEEKNRYKAMKYHYKNQALLLKMRAEGKAYPAHYDKYLKAFE